MLVFRMRGLLFYLFYYYYYVVGKEEGGGGGVNLQSSRILFWETIVEKRIRFFLLFILNSCRLRV